TPPAPWAAPPGHSPQGPGLRPGYQYPAVDGQRQRPELALADEVEDRLAGRAARQERLEAIESGGRDGSGGPGDEARTVDPEHMREQHLGIGTRLGHARSGQALLGGTQRVGEERHQLATC